MHRRRLAIVAALAVWMHSCSGYAQTLTVTPTAAKPGEPIVAALTDVPAINDVSLRTITWSSDDATKMLAVDSGQHVWATAGPHWIAAKLDTELRESRDILVPGPNWATDKSDVKLEKLVYLVDKTSVTVRAEFAVEGVIPPPTPVPPTPVPPTPSGKRQVVIIYETVDKTPALARLLTDTQAGAVAKYLKDRGHPSAKVLDDDILPDALKSKLGNLPPLPAMIVMDASTGAVTLADQLPATSAAVTELIKRAGG